MWVYLYPNNTETELKNAYIWIPFPTSIVLDKSSISLTTIWQTEQLTATLTPTPCDQSITWSSDDTTIATVSTTGLVTCVTPWTATITATTVNGLTATCGVSAWFVPPASPIAYYILETDATDSSWNGKDASWVWTPSYTTVWWEASAHFAGSDYINTWVSIGSWPVTIACMYNHSTSSGYQTVFWARLAWDGGSYPYIWALFYNNGIFFKAGYYSESEWSAPTVPTWEWHFCAVRIDWSRNIKMDRDTSQVTATTTSYTINESINIWAWVWNKFYGNVKQLAIWDKSLTDAELEEYRVWIMGS